MIKGKTRIQLFRAGEKIKEIEEKNTFQDAVLQKVLRSLGDYSNTWPFNRYSQAKWSDLLGGIYLFDSQIEIGTQYPPAGINMLGNGATGIANGGAAEMGSWNATESSVTEGLLRMTWDFAESQGNGNIQSCCLTSKIGGAIGIGNPSGSINGTTWNIYEGQSSNQLVKGQTVIDDCIYWMDSIGQGDDHVTVHRKRASVDRLDIYLSPTSDDIAEDIIIPITTEAGTPTSVRNLPWTATPKSVGNGYFMIVYPQGSWPNTNEINYVLIDVKNRTAVANYTPNRFAETIGANWNSGYNYENGVWPVSKDYIICKGNNRFNVYLVNIHTGDFSNLSEGMSGLKDIATYGNRLDTNSMTAGIAEGRVIVHPWAFDNKGPMVVDLEAGTARRINMGFYNGRYMDQHDLLLNDGRAYKSPFYLATINNFEEPLTKDGTMRMKVTYTLEEARVND